LLHGPVLKLDLLVNLLDYLAIFHYSQSIYPWKDIKAMPNNGTMTVKELAEYLKIVEKTTYCFAS